MQICAFNGSPDTLLLLFLCLFVFSMGEATTTNGVGLLPIKKNQEECPVRHMTDSYQEVIIPLGQDPVVREKYISFLKGLRFGRILEDLDTFAGLVHDYKSLNIHSVCKLPLAHSSNI